MTIAIALQVHDGIVLASDSALTLTDNSKTGPESVLNVYNNGNKIFNLLKGLPIGAVFYGTGSVGTSSIPTLVKDLRRRFAGEISSHRKWKIDSKAYTIEAIAKQAREFLFEENFKPAGGTATGTQFGFIVAGYSSGAQLSEAWSFEVSNGNCSPPTLALAQGAASAIAGGDPDVFARLVTGAGLKLRDALKAIGIPDAEIPAKEGIARAVLSDTLVEAPMPIQDAIDLAEFLVDTTATFTRFKRGASTVGGPTESAAITKHEGFKWVRRKHYFDEALNPKVSR